MVIVDDGERADARGRQILDRRTADPARADDGDMACQQLRLTCTANFAEDDVAGVTVELGVGKGDWVGCPIALCHPSEGWDPWPYPLDDMAC